jgi:succinate-semialdehyde dehydrogenase/glutarate-semialdehyde dehydrogenase
MSKRSLAPVFAGLLPGVSGAVAAGDTADGSEPLILVAKPELRDELDGSTNLMVTPLGGDQHVGFIVNRPSTTRLGTVFPEHGPSQKIVDPVKKSVMELGGSDPFIVLPSANLDAAVKTAVAARNINNGQSCIAAKRFIVHARVYDEFERRIVQALERLKIGDPMREDIDVGPLAIAQGAESIQRQVDESVKAGARLLTGGKRLDGPGNFYAVSALADIPRHAPAYREEVFGPVALLFKARDVGEAIEIANAADYGLGSSVWTNDEAERRRCIDELEAGATFVNAMVISDPRLPFRGVKRSGYGRELARHGIREFVNIKAVSITERPAGAGSDTE